MNWKFLDFLFYRRKFNLIKKTFKRILYWNFQNSILKFSIFCFKLMFEFKSGFIQISTQFGRIYKKYNSASASENFFEFGILGINVSCVTLCQLMENSLGVVMKAKDRNKLKLKTWEHAFKESGEYNVVMCGEYSKRRIFLSSEFWGLMYLV